MKGETPLDIAKSFQNTRIVFIFNSWPHIADGCLSQKFNAAWKAFVKDPTRQFISENAEDIFKRIRMHNLQRVTERHFVGTILDKNDCDDTIGVNEAFGEENYHFLAAEDLSNKIGDILEDDQHSGFGEGSDSETHVEYTKTGLHRYSHASTWSAGLSASIKSANKNVKVSIALKAPSRTKKLEVRLDQYLAGEADPGFRDRQLKPTKVGVRPMTTYTDVQYATNSKKTKEEKGYQKEESGWANHYSQSNRHHKAATQILSSVKSNSTPSLGSFQRAERPATSTAILRQGPVNDSKMLTQVAIPKFVVDSSFKTSWTLTSPMLKLVADEAKSYSKIRSSLNEILYIVSWILHLAYLLF